MTKNSEQTDYCMAEASYHCPVMLREAVEALQIKPDGVYADMTYGGGGHSRAIVERLSREGHLYGFDQDLDALEGAISDPRFTFVRSNFRFLRNWMRYYEVDALDGILADLGLSSHHLDTAERGFSFRFDAPLDMRMNQRARLTAADVVNEYSEERLSDVLYLYGELRTSRRLAAAIVKARAEQRIATTGRLSDLLRPILGPQREKKELAKVFQALRIEVNGEMKALGQMLEAAAALLRPGGRLVVLTYHSLEDRMVKNLIRSGNLAGRVATDLYGRTLAPLTAVGRAAVPSEEEQVLNPRSRSAKLRVGEKLNPETNSNAR